MINKTTSFFLFSFLLFFAKPGFSQIEVTGSVTSIGFGPGITMFFGDIGNIKDDISKFSQIKFGYHASLEQRIGNILAFSADCVFGKLGESDKTKTVNRNFESELFQGNLNLVLHFDNGIILPRTSQVAPYLTVGIGYTRFDPYGDLLDENGKPYYYWTDGSIRNLPQVDTNIKKALVVKRDYNYETQLTDPVTNYERNTLAIPLGFGIKMKLTNSLDFNIGSTYYMTMSDYLDNVKDGKNDNYVYSHFTLQFNFGYKKILEKENPRYENVDFSSIDKLDTDGDGVLDLNDKCPGTPSGVKTDSKGCPLDSDGDGVGDHLDKEPNTRKGAIVNEQGVTQTDEELARKQALWDSLATERSNLFNENPSLRYLKNIDVQATQERASGTKPVSQIPADLKPADLNNDGYISSDEIIAMIDGFFEGSSDFTVEKLNKLIDYFFEQ